MQTQGVYEDYHQTHIGQTNRLISVRTKSLEAQHLRATLNSINFNSTKIIPNIERCTSRIFIETIMIKKRANNLNTRNDI